MAPIPSQTPPGSPLDSPDSRRVRRQGLAIGSVAIVFWSFSSALVFLGARAAGTWRFVAVASLIGGGAQLVGWRLYRGEWRSALFLPWRLWAVSVPCFVLYGLVFPLALNSSSPRQVFGVSLINYLWPVLTVLLGAVLVPGARLTRRSVLAALLALAGLACANFQPLRELLASTESAGASAPSRLLPYALALVAAVTWAVYSAVLARWRGWAGKHATSPAGFLITGAAAGALALLAPAAPVQLSAREMIVIFGYGIGPLAVGYLLWEIALSKARVQGLSMIGAVTPVLSTLLLCLFLRSWPGPELIVAALLVAAGVLLSVRE